MTLEITTWQFGFFAVAIFLDAVKDHINFHLLWDNGFWSLHTTDVNDAWHSIKKLEILCFILAIVGPNLPAVVLLAITNLVIHVLTLNVILPKLWR